MKKGYPQKSIQKLALSICLSVLTASFSSFAADENTLVTEAKKEDQNEFKSNWTSKWKMGLSAGGEQSAQTATKTSALNFALSIQYNLLEALSLNIRPGVSMSTGTSQSIENPSEVNGNRLSLRHASADLKPSENFILSAGILNQGSGDTMNVGHVMGDMPFPGMRAEVPFMTAKGKSALYLESAVPTTSELNPRTQDFEPSPSYNTAGLNLNFGDAEAKKAWSGNLFAGVFSFENLPMSVAGDSSTRGNTTQIISKGLYQFNYKYKGYQARTGLHIPLANRWSSDVSYEYSRNTQAPESLNQGQTASLTIDYQYSAKYAFQYSTSGFRIEPDATVAAFAGETNRVGYDTGAKMTFKKNNFSVGAYYSDAQVIFVNTPQSRNQSLTLKLETDYAKF